MRLHLVVVAPPSVIRVPSQRNFEYLPVASRESREAFVRHMRPLCLVPGLSEATVPHHIIRDTYNM